MNQKPNINPNNNGKKPGRMPGFNLTWLYLAIIIGLGVMLYQGNSTGSGGLDKEVDYSTFRTYVQQGIAKEVVVNKSDGNVHLVVKPEFIRQIFKAGTDQTGTAPTVSAKYPTLDSVSGFLDANYKGGVRFEENNNFFTNLISSIVPILLLVFLWFFLMNRMGGGSGAAGGIFSVGKSKARIFEKNGKNSTNVTFKDVAGQEGAKQEIREIVDFLKNPQKYTELGGKIPKGALLVGPPGTGKTLLAKAVAGEADVPFFSMAGSDFVEMFVGVGASRVRDLFKEAKSQAPSIIFIDEIDAVGRQRGAGLGGGHDEREQTLNQLLVEMDGFEESESVILIAATNRPDILDPALLRPGRFDRQVTVDRPDVKGREQILRVHAENKPMDEDVKFEKLAQMTVGFTGADLANLLNESALLAARRHRSVISMDEVEESMERVIAGPQRKGRVMTEAERTTIAYHESGHALVGHILEHSDPVHKISIVSRGQALGYTLQLPQEDHFLKTKNEMLDELAVFLGGRVAEELMCDDITSGASNDLERATKMAREMVTRLGMSEELGTQVFGEAQHQVFLGRDYADHQDYSEETARRIDIEVQRIMREAHRRAVEILDARRDQLDLMAKVLLERETVEGDAVNALLDNEWDSYLEREGDILAAKEERNAKAAGMPTKKRAPRMSEEELAADAAAFAQAAMQEDAEDASDDAGDDHAVNAGADTDDDK